jgi:hypothetical protein
LQIFIHIECFLKWCIHNLLMNVPFVDVIYNKFLLPLPICGRDIEHFVAFSIAHLECMLHLKHINFTGWPYNWHGYHVVEWYVHPSLGFGMNLMPFQHLSCFDLMFHLDLEDALINNCIGCLQLHRRHRS